MTIAYFLLIGSILGLTLLPLIKGKRDRVSIAFFLMGLASIQWVFSIFFLSIHPENELMVRLAFFGPLLTATSIFFISLYYPAVLAPKWRRIQWLGFIPAAIIVTIPTHWIVRSLQGITVIYGPGHSIYALVILYFFTMTLAVFAVNYFRLRGLDRLRLLYLILGIGLTGFGAISTNLILPLLGITAFHFYGPFFTLFLIGSLAYGMLRHRLMDIQIVIKKGFFYAFLISSISIVFSAFVMISGPYINRLFGLGEGATTLLAAALIVLVYPKLRDFFDTVTDRIFFRKKYDYQYTLRNFSQSLSTMIDLNEVTNALVRMVPETMKIGQVGFYSIEGSEEMLLRASLGDPQFAHTIDSDWIGGVFGELPYLIRSEMAEFSSMTAKLALMDSVFPAFELVFPIRINSELFGLYVLGEKRSGELYSGDDVSLLETLIHQANTAIQNATHYRELQKNIADLSALNEFAFLINQSFDLHQIAFKIHEVYASLFGFQGIGVLLIDLERNGFWPQSSDESDLGPGRRSIYKADIDGLSRLFLANPVLLELQIAIDSGVLGDGFIDRILDQFGSAVDIQLMPFLNGQKLVGFAIGKIASGRAKKSWMLMSTISQEAASALDNALLYHQVLGMKNYNEDILQNMSNAVLMTDGDLVISGMNKKAEELLQQSRGKMVGRSVSELLGFCPQLSVIEKSKSTQKGYSLEARLINAGISTPISISTGLLRGNDQEVMGVICIISDLTLIKELQGQVEQANRLSSLGTMAAGIAHEIKNPLVSIKAFSQMLPSYWDDNQFRTKYQTIVIPQIDRINDLCFSLLRLGKPQRPELGIHSLSEVMDRVVELLASERKAKRASISKEFALPDRIVCDPAQVEQIFINLVLNGLQAINEAGKGALKITIAPAAAGYVKATVSDNGEGISEAGIARLFDPFYSTKKGGTGLGLSIVYKIIDEHRGRIYVDSTVGVGTTFSVYLPTENADPDFFFETAERPR